MTDQICLESDLVSAKDDLSPAARVSDIEYAAVIAMFVFCLLACVVNASIFFWFKRDYQRLRVRVGCFTLLYLIAILLFIFGMVFPLLIGITHVPCWFVYGATILSIGFFIGTNYTRGSTFMLMTRLAVCTYDYGRIPIDETSAEEERLKRMGFFERSLEELKMVWYALTFFFKTNAIKRDMPREDQVKTLVTLRFITGIKGSSLFSFVCIFPTTVMIAIVIACVPPFAAGCVGCSPTNLVTAITIGLLGTWGTLNAVLFAIKCRNYPDTWGVFQESRLSARGIVVALIGFFLQTFLPVDNRFMFTIVLGVGFITGLTMVTTYQVFVARKTENRVFINSQRPSAMMPRSEKKNSLVASDSTIASTGSNLGLFHPASDLRCSRLSEVLGNPASARAFEYHLATEFGGENLCFLQDAFDWMTSYNDVSKSASLARAKKLINTYVSSNGLYQINISSQMADPLLRILDDKTVESVPRQIFDAARAEIAILLENGPVPRFVSSKEYSNIIAGDVVVQNMT